jgi:hypothetical protein
MIGLQNITVPFDKDGNLIYDVKNADMDKVIWKDNFTFQDVLLFQSAEKGNSRMRLIFRSRLNHKTYSMFMVDMEDMLHKKNIVNGEVYGKWSFVKRGLFFGITMAE